MSKKLKIAVFHNLPASGALKALQDNINILKKNGHYVDVYTTDTLNDSFAPLDKYADHKFVYPVKKGKLRRFILKTIEKIIPSTKFNKESEIFINYNDFKKTLKQMAEDIDRKNYDLILLEQDYLFSVTPVIFKYLKTLKIYYCQQPYRGNEQIVKKLRRVNIKSSRQKLYEKLFMEKHIKLDVDYAQYTDYMLCNSYFSHENLLRYYGINAQVSYLGINTEQFKPMNLPRKDVVMSVGSISPHKGFDFIIRSLSKIDKKIRPKFIIVGYASNRAWVKKIKSLANELNVDLEIISGIPYEDLVELYNEVKLVIFAPYLEAFGLVPLEASACGTPVIGVKEGGVRETVAHMKTGLSLDRNEFIFADGITELLTNQELWNKFSEYGPKYVNEFWTLDHAGERLLNHIYQALEEEKKK